MGVGVIGYSVDVGYGVDVATVQRGSGVTLPAVVDVAVAVVMRHTEAGAEMPPKPWPLPSQPSTTIWYHWY